MLSALARKADIAKVGGCASMAGGAGRRSAAGHAAKAGMNTSGAGGLYPSEACGLIVL
jgi:hypothetical protein